MASNPAASKYVLTTDPALPQKCSGCGIPSKGYNQFVDFNLSLDYYGAVVFCIDCCKEIVHLIGYCSVAERDQALAEVDHYAEKLTDAYTQIKALEDVVSAYFMRNVTNVESLTSSSDSDEDTGEKGTRNVFG